jgi:DNA (cytosine-5)-methyltransferase 1
VNVLDLFSGIGGFSLGLERAGMRTVAFCEIDPFCRRVLAKHWPGVPCADDITAREFREGEADIVCGGFPCQDISNAGERAGIAGERSGLWRELLRAIRLVRPRYAIVENVAALLSRGMGTVLGDLAEIGADAEWHCIPASSVGAPHQRDRVWIVAYPDGGGWPTGEQAAAAVGHGRTAGAGRGDLPDTVVERVHVKPLALAECGGALLTDRDGAIRQVADADDSERQPSWSPGRMGWLGVAIDAVGIADIRDHWAVEPDVGRVADGVPGRVDRLKSLGNAVVPQIPEIIGRAILSAQKKAEG